MAKKREAKSAKKDSAITRYFKEVRAEVQKVSWPNRRHTLNLTMIILGVTATMSAAMGLLDWIFAKLFSFIIG